MSDPTPADRPAGGGGGGGGGGPSLVFCHQCGIEVRPLMAPDPTCPRCNGQFVEVIEEGSGGHPRDLHSFFGDELNDEDDDEAAYMAHTAGAGGPFGRMPDGGFGVPFGGGAGGARPDLGGLIQGLLGAVAANRATGRQQQQPSSPGAARDQGRGSNPGPDDDGSGRDRGSFQQRQGTSQFGPLNIQWGFQYGSGSSADRHRQENREGDRDGGQAGRTTTQGVPPLSDFLRTAFGPRDLDPQPAAGREDNDTHFHDDGMGGAGSASDGRRFNHDNQGGLDDGGPRRDDLPPELAGLRNLFTGLFGGNLDGGGLVFDFLGGGGGGGGARGQWGDYVLGQQGLDDIISQLMEQTQGSNAPPPAGDEEIQKLRRFKLSDADRVAKAKNRDCPTCKEDFLPEEQPAAAQQRDESDDPPEQAVEDEEKQQEDLAMMPCGHLFHEDCLVPWLKMHGTCPVCRISIVKQDGAQHQQQQRGGQQSTSAAASTATTDTAAGQGSVSNGRDDEPAIPGGFPSTNPFLRRMDPQPEQHSGRATDQDEETPEQRRERMRAAAEARQRAPAEGEQEATSSSSSSSRPLSFLQPDELD
ncbi:uncharacterized protein PFL1_00898 [Pseudozyma flocculosa PF-1]|uniref:RING-type E3 ubiquitin transferase n=1 Tax=Pseudozyma flocculosa TaxID=84751 RepID=A0A5C3F2D4_9BASI|nr:uncharacterized protein PFL1_00898 [Pseudozyma flocculosa PF-1]EPQ31565.1 hypothetical protein PFL1_00898 [Pseudozyma flocculosa PF-1]SPO38644.1 uncharacterized protein PSFLO_04123 [Pseudozyma flocculosa]